MVKPQYFLFMKKLVILAVAFTLSAGAFAQDSSMSKTAMGPKMGHKMMKDGVMMKDGKMMMMKDGKKMAMDKDMTMSNGTMVKDGKTMMMKDGDKMSMDGKMMSKMKMDKEKMKMDKSMQ